MRSKRWSMVAGALLMVVVASVLTQTPVLGKGGTLLAASNANNNDLQTATVIVDDKTFFVQIAQTPAEQELGLGKRASLIQNAGMLFPFNPPIAQPFWMKDMRFPLDIIWMASGVVTQVSHDLPPPAPNTNPANLLIYAPPGPVDNVLEVNAGQARTIKVGDHVTFNITNQS